MAKRRRKIVFLTAGLLFGVWAVVYLIGAFSDERLLWAVCHEADRVVVNFDVYPEKHRKHGLPEYPRYEVSGADKVAELFEALDFKPHWITWYCKCYGDALFEFYKGDERLAVMSYHHRESLNWRDGQWSGHAGLTEGSRAAIDVWLQSNGCPTAKEMDQRMRPRPPLSNPTQTPQAEGNAEQ